MIERGDSRLQAALEPARFIRLVYLGRLAVATAIFIAAIANWLSADAEMTLVATLGFALAMVFTALSFIYTELQRRPLTVGVRVAQLAFDVLLVTGVVHITGGAASQFAALYILVNASAALLLPFSGAALLAAFGMVSYAAEVLLLSDSTLSLALGLQLLVFVTVALGTAYIAARLQEAGAGRERLQAELASVRLREADILANIRSGIVTVDTAGTLLFANPMAGELLGIPLASWIGRPVLGELARRVPELSAALAIAARREGTVSRVEGELERDGHVTPVGITTTFTPGDGRHVPPSAMAIFQDISDQKRLEQLNLRAQRLEAVAELSASLAHEIKNPLAAVRSAVEQLARRAGAGEDDRVLSELIVRESDRLSRLLSEFLDFARVRAARMERLDLLEVARAAAALAEAHPTRDPSVSVVVEGSSPLSCEGDEDLLHRAVFNLVLNAVQASPPGGTVHVHAGPAAPRSVPSGVEFAGGALAVQVSDQGSGIPEEVRDRLFEPFATTKPGGSGLGLAVCHRATEAHRGFVLVDSTPHGTRFTILIPGRHPALGGPA